MWPTRASGVAPNGLLRGGRGVVDDRRALDSSAAVGMTVCGRARYLLDCGRGLVH